MIKTPKLEQLRVGDLHVDAYAQRSFDPNWVKRLTKSWSDAEAGVYRVSRRDDGRDYVFDGQHRRAALLDLKRADDKVPALVYVGLTLAEEARLFVAYNAKTRRPNPIDIFRLSVVAEDPDSVAINNVLADHGLTVAFGAGGNTIAAVASLRWLYEKGNVTLIDEVLSLVEAAWGPSNRDARDGSLLKGIGYVLLNASPRLDVVSLADKLGKQGKPGALVGSARTYKQATGKALWLEVAHAVVATYNRQRTTRRVSL